MNNTISAVSTPRGEGGIGIVRLNGSASIPIIKKIFKPRQRQFNVSNAKTHTLLYGHIVDPDTDEILDEVLVSIMLAPRTYTREDIVEINCHGGSVPISKVLELTLRMGARLAEPGEFTKRAFLNGRIDLAQAEAVADIIRAKTDLSLKVALNQLGGKFSEEINHIRAELIDLLASVEASIDFPDEDLEFISSENLVSNIQSLINKLDLLLSTADEGKIITEGLRGVIIGRPNVGKSSLFNALLREKRSIVTSIPGTTRDAIEEFINLKGIPLKLTDTAGIRHTDDVIEIESIERTRVYLDNADILILIIDASEPLTDDDKELISLTNNRKAILILNKIDLPQHLKDQEIKTLVGDMPIVKISVVKETGLEQLKLVIHDMFIHDTGESSDAVFVTKARHKNALKNAKESLKYVMDSVIKNLPAELIAVDLRGSLKSLGEIFGETASEEILNQIFAKFCIGK